MAETMGLMNGVQSINYVSFRTLFVKFIGVSFASASGLCVGTAEPLI